MDSTAYIVVSIFTLLVLIIALLLILLWRSNSKLRSASVRIAEQDTFIEEMKKAKPAQEEPAATLRPTGPNNRFDALVTVLPAQAPAGFFWVSLSSSERSGHFYCHLGKDDTNLRRAQAAEKDRAPLTWILDSSYEAGNVVFLAPLPRPTVQTPSVKKPE